MNQHMLQKLKMVAPGAVAVSGDPVFEKARKMFNRVINPSVVVRPETSEDVASVIRFVKENNIPFAVRSGGHHAIANRLADGILLIDMSGLKSVKIVDAEKGHVRVGTGALWYDVAEELEKHGLAISSGDTKTVGVGGLATGGGIGWILRQYGPVVDNTVSAEVVTADGQILEASETKNSDLFWAIRGGGSNFGVVTHFTFLAHPVQGVHAATIKYAIKDADAVIKGWRDAMRQAPAELTTMLTVLPAFGDNKPSIMVQGCFADTDKAAADRAYAPFLALGPPVHQEVKAIAYKDMLEEGMMPPNKRVVVHNAFLKSFSDEAVDAIVQLCKQPVPPILQIRHVAGVMNDRPLDATAFSHRDSEVLIVNPTFVDPQATDQEVDAHLKAWHTIQPFQEGCYLNLLSEDTGKEIKQAFPPATLERLQKVKAQYDSDNLFKANYNISPSNNL